MSDLETLYGEAMLALARKEGHRGRLPPTMNNFTASPLEALILKHIKDGDTSAEIARRINFSNASVARGLHTLATRGLVKKQGSAGQQNIWGPSERLAGVHIDGKVSERRQRILDAMQGEMTVAEIAEKTFSEIGMDTGQIRNSLNDLRKMGEVTRVGTIRCNDRFVATWARV